jgi:hypothetical protein
MFNNNVSNMIFLTRNYKKIFEFLAFFLFSVLFSFFILKYQHTEGLYLASFFYDLVFLSKYFDGLASAKDFLSPFGEHGMLGFNCISILNAKFFHLSNLPYTILNISTVIVSAYLLIRLYIDTNFRSKFNFSYYLCFLLILIIMFSPYQGNTYSMEVQVRIGLFFSILTMYMLDKQTNSAKVDKTLVDNTFYVLIFLILFGSTIFGTFYSFAAFPFSFLLLLKSWIDSKFKSNKFLILFFIYLLSLIFYFALYRPFIHSPNLPITSYGKNLFISILSIYADHPLIFLKALLAYFGSFVLGYASIVDNHISVNNYLLVGFLILIIYSYAIFLFFKSKMSAFTQAPLLFASYTFCLGLFVLIGRGSQITSGDFLWLANNWYWVHTKIAMASIVWIASYSLCSNLSFKHKFFISIGILFITLTLAFGLFYDLRRAPSAFAWYKNFEHYLKVEPINLPLDSNGLTPFYVDKNLASSGLVFLREHKLSVFRESYDDKN